MLTFRKPRRRHLTMMASLVIALLNLQAMAAGEIDLSFIGTAVRTHNSNPTELSIAASVVLPDGKILIGGGFTSVGSHARKGVVRLNPDGTVDPTFNPPQIDRFIQYPNFTVAATVTALGVQPDGKIIVAGDFGVVNGAAFPRIVRLNGDGSLDTAFTTMLHQNLTQWEGTIRDIEVQTDGKIVLAGDPVSFLTQNSGRIIRGVSRLTADGNYDNSFNTEPINMSVYEIDILPDGRIYVAGSGTLSFNFVGLARLMPTGLIDFSFQGVSVRTASGQNTGTVYDFEVLPSGQIAIVGNFTQLNGFTHGSVGRINSDGTIDLNFNTNNNGADPFVRSLAQEPGGKLIIGGTFTSYNTGPRPRLARLAPDGLPDESFTFNATGVGQISEIELLSGGRILIAGELGSWERLRVLNSDGTPASPVDNLPGRSALIRDVVSLPDGKVVTAGRFTTASGAPRNNVARYNADGTIDTGFVPFVGVNPVFIATRAVPVADGKLLVGAEPASIVRLNADGSKDLTFLQTVTNFTFISNVKEIALLPDGRYVAFGQFGTTSTSGTHKAVRFHPTGAVDAVLPVSLEGGDIERAIVQPDGKLIVAGSFTQINGVNRGRIARLNIDGTVDLTFNPPGGANAPVNDVALQPDGKVVLVGEFDALNGNTARRFIGRLNADGSLDTGFAQTADFFIVTVEVQADGKILIGGYMNTVGGVSRRGIARLNWDGSVDTSFNVGSGTNNPVRDIAIQTDGKVVAGGDFTTFNGFSRISLVRLLNAAGPVTKLFDYDGDGRADVSVFRPSENRWYVFRSSDSVVAQQVFAITGDVPVPADYDGDGKTDYAIFRPSSGDWWYLSSSNGAQVFVDWGVSGDIPMASDFDGDGRSDMIVFRPSDSTWYRISNTINGTISNIQFGLSGDRPVRGDFDGDGKSDPAIFRPSTGDWWYRSSINGAQLAVRWGISTDIPAPADFDGDGRTDPAVYRPSTGVWYIINSSNGSFTITHFGLSEDKPVPADYDGDGKADIAVFRPSTGIWYLLRSTGGFTATQFGVATDIPTPNSFVY